jgi:hypothetical protein
VCSDAHAIGKLNQLYNMEVASETHLTMTLAGMCFYQWIVTAVREKNGVGLLFSVGIRGVKLSLKVSSAGM